MNFLYKIYFALPNFARIGIIGKVINRLLSMLLKRIFDATVPAYLKRTAHRAGYGLNTGPRDETYIVSLTSFPARINDLWITVETILRQSFKPDKVILWLAEEQFPGRKLSDSLLQLQKRGLTIEFCDEDLRSHKKYFYAMQQYPDANIITLDDDSYYPKDVLSKVVDLHKKYPKAICANRAHKITFGNNRIKKYRNWKINYNKILSPSYLLVPTGVGGVLYPPHSLSPSLFEKELFKEICFQADDLWLKVNGILVETKVVTNKYFNKDLIAVSKTQNEKLLDNNSYGGGNDSQLISLLNYFDLTIHPDS
jgi:hypothetical protein